MTTIHRMPCKCSRCGKVSEFAEIMSTNMIGASDLDMRPPEMKRGTMPYWVQECPQCGYVSEHISDKTEAPDELFLSDDYLFYGGVPFVSELAKKFYRLYLVRRAEGKAERAFWFALYAAWASDDSYDREVAVACRRLALEQLEIVLERSPNESFKLARLDLLRRVREFDAVVNYAAAFRSDNPFCMKVAAFQSELAKRQDDYCYNCAEVPTGDEGEKEKDDE